MSTQAQIDANRQNAQLSSGPKSEAGKAASSRNSLTHGLTARILKSLPEAIQEEFYAHRDALAKQFNPVNHLEDTLLEIYAFALFQHQRAAAYEYVAMEEALANEHDTELRHKWERLIRICQSKQREASKAFKNLNEAILNRLIASQLSEEMNKEIPASTPFLQTSSNKQISRVVNPYTLSVAALFPEFDPKPFEDQAVEGD